MPSKIITPGVYIEEKNAFPASAVAVPTAIPVFIGYTEFAEWNGKSLLQQATRITSLEEYTYFFGAALNAKFSIVNPDPNVQQDTFTLNGISKIIKINDQHTAYLYNSIRLFFENGGGACYILALNTYGGSTHGLEINVDDFTGSTTKADPFESLKKVYEPTLMVMPDAIALGAICYTSVYTKVLLHCAATQSRFAIFDLIHQGSAEETEAIVNDFREKIGVQALNYGAAYYPWLKAAVIQPAEVTLENLDASVDLEHVLPEVAAIQLVKELKENQTPDADSKKNYHLALKAASPTYNIILDAIRFKWNELPPSGAMAGVYANVDSNHGVWKSPANIFISAVNAPTVNVSHVEQEGLNVDVKAGKSINVIRSFPGKGTLLWGARTLDGNSMDWKYINVRRTMIMIEQSLKLATRPYLFEPNDAATWVAVKSMIVNFLTGLWKQGCLPGSTPEEAFTVQIGMGATMTAEDILNGIIRVMALVAIVRPAEFIEITFEQQMQQA
jgi:phage tail sheath protein FI